MTQVASRELRNDTAGLLQRAAHGEDIVITVRGEPVARLVPVRTSRRHRVSGVELVERLQSGQADPGLRNDLARLASETTDELGPIR